MTATLADARRKLYTPAQPDIPPRDRTDTMPAGLPEYTLGFGVIAWIYDNLVHVDDGPRAGLPFELTRRQAMFLLWYYAVDENGDWLFITGVRRLAKGSGKSPFAAVHALAELLGPVRFAHFDDTAPGGVVGRPVSMPLVQVAATSENQTANTMRNVRAMASKKSKLYRRYRLDIGKTFVETPNGGRLENIASSATSAEGAVVTFAICDETEHWLPGNNGPGLMSTLRRNAAKSGSRVVETSNAWVPGRDSVAETTYETWALQQEGKSRATREVLYDAVIAPANTALTDDPEPGMISLEEGLQQVYEDCPWIDVRVIKEEIWQTNTRVSEARAFFLNQPSAADSGWVAPHQWEAIADRTRELEDGEDVVLFFDGSKSNDHSALVGCCLSDGHIFTVGVWEPDEITGVVDADAINGVVQETRERFRVVAFWADVREFESYVHTTWPALFSDDDLMPAVPHGKAQALIAWDMRSHSRDFAIACEMTYDEIAERAFTHDGDGRLSRHVANARLYESRSHYAIRKESKKSPNKIDAAVCMVGARMVYRHVISSDDYDPNPAPTFWRIG